MTLLTAPPAPIGDGYGSYLLLLAVGVLASEVWRWLGVALAKDLDVESEVFMWVKAVATALLAGLVMRFVLFPSGALATVAMPVRIVALAGGIAAFWVARRHLGIGIGVATALLVAGAYAI